MLKFLIDESSGKRLAVFLIGERFDVKYVGDIMPTASDIEVLAFAKKEDRILITNDKDFGEFIFRLREHSSGIILLRLREDSPYQRQKYVHYLLNNLSEKLKSSFVVVTEGKIRVRKI